jgi:two-component system nitrogen regulation sensor histidine kinase NtrY
MEWTSSAISYLLIIVIGSIFIFGLALARRISKPINDLIQGTLRIGSGDLSFTIPRSGDDEIGDLVSSFNMMTTALAKSRKSLSERKRYIETIIGNVGAGIVSTDWKGRIDTFNSAAEKLLGVRARNARGREARYLLKRIGASGLAAVLDEVGDEKGMARREVNLPRGERGQVTLRAVASAVRGPKGRRMGKVIVFEDVTELIRSKQLIAWSEMARQVAHEIKNPLTPMKLSAQQLLQSHRDGASDFDTTLEESVATIVEQIESLRRIAVEFSRFSRMPERKLEIGDVNEILEDSLGQYERTIGGSIEISKMLDRSVPKVKIDRDELKRVFLNLIENAVQAMPRGGRLTVRSLRSWGRPEKPEYDFSVTSRGANEEPLRGYVEISMADTGEFSTALRAEFLHQIPWIGAWPGDMQGHHGWLRRRDRDREHCRCRHLCESANPSPRETYLTAAPSKKR